MLRMNFQSIDQDDKEIMDKEIMEIYDENEGMYLSSLVDGIVLNGNVQEEHGKNI